ncbi:MAG: rhomboid family intramembrane serine protease [Actinomycetes bacterium]
MTQPYGHWSPPASNAYAPAPRPFPMAPAPTTLMGSSFFVGGWLVLLWFIEVVDLLLGGTLDAFGISPRDVTELPQVFSAPLLHFGFGHLMANSLPFLVLGVLTRLAGRREFWVATGASVVVSGLFAWLLSAQFTVTAGASGLVFGWLAFLLVRGIFAGNWVQILVSAAVFGFFGGMLWGIFPTMPGISWQGHLGGAVGGVLAAWWLSRRR